MSKKTHKTKMSLTELAAMRGVSKPEQVGCTFDAELAPRDYAAEALARKAEEESAKSRLLAEKAAKKAADSKAEVSLVKLPLHCGKVNANSKRQARVLFELKNEILVCDADIARAWAKFDELPELGEYELSSEPSAYYNDHRVVICSDGIFPYQHGQEIEGILRRDGRTIHVSDGYYIGVLHRGSLVSLRYKKYVREYVRRCCTSDIRHEASKHEATAMVSKMADEAIDLMIRQVWLEYPLLPEEDTAKNSGAEWHWNDRDV